MGKRLTMSNDEAVEWLLSLKNLDICGENRKTAIDKAVTALKAQPCIEDYPTCTECEHYDSEKHYCPRFCQVIKDTLAEAQPCENTVSRTLVHEAITASIAESENPYEMWQRIEALPPVTPQRPKGKWIEVFVETPNDPYSYGFKSHKCSKCEYSPLQISNYCPNCGADMSGGGEDEVSD